MSKKRNKVKRKLFSFLVAGSVLGFLYTGKELVKNTNIIAEVPWDVRNELYHDDILDDYHYFKEYGRYTSIGLYMQKATDSDYLLDKFVTYDSLKELTTLELHLEHIDNLEFLKDCPNIKELYINESELLNDEDIDIINNSNIEKVVLSFNTNNIQRIKENKFDVSRIKKQIVINNSFYSFIDDLQQLTFYNYLINYDESMFSDQKNLKSIKEMDNYFNNIISKYKIREASSDKEKVMLISDYICNNLHYDEDVSDYIDEYLKKSEDEDVFFKADEKSKNYNNYSISSVINQEEKDKSAVCKNYASLFDILCYKVGVKSRIVEGVENNVRLGHAWNIVYLENNDQEYVDLTFYDSISKEILLKEYGLSKDEYLYESIEDSLFKNVNDNYNEYNLYTKIEDLDKGIEKNHVYLVNDSLDGLYMVKEDIKLKPFFLSFFLGGIIGLSFDDIKNKKTKKKSLEKVLNVKF